MLLGVERMLSDGWVCMSVSGATTALPGNNAWDCSKFLLGACLTYKHLHGSIYARRMLKVPASILQEQCRT